MTVCPNFLRVATETWGRFIRIRSVFKSNNSVSVRSKILRRGATLHIQNKSTVINIQISFKFFMYGEPNLNLH